MKRMRRARDVKTGCKHPGDIVKRFLSALGFLTRIPVPEWALADRASLAASPPYFPAVGAIIGLGWAAFDLLLTRMFPLPVACALDLLFLFIVTGGLHWDGLSDTADGLLGGRTREDALRIMRDSRIGAMGAIAIALLLLTEYALLVSLPVVGVMPAQPAFGEVAGSICDGASNVLQVGLVPPGSTGFLGRSNLARDISFDRTLSLTGRVPALLLAPVLGRWAMLLGMELFPYARKESGMGTVFSCWGGQSEMVQEQGPGQLRDEGPNSRPKKRLYVSGALTVLSAVGVAGMKGACAFILCSLVASFWGRKVSAFLGGLTGDTYGALCEFGEIVALLVFCTKV